MARISTIQQLRQQLHSRTFPRGNFNWLFIYFEKKKKKKNNLKNEAIDMLIEMKNGN